MMVSEEEIIDLALSRISEIKRVANDVTSLEKSLKNFKKSKGKNFLELIDSVDAFFNTLQSHAKTAQSDYQAKVNELKSAKKQSDTNPESQSKSKKKEKRNKSIVENEKKEASPDKDGDNNVPKIRLVDLNKLIDPSVKKSVTFDNSVIILTSSDEENSTPRKTKGHNGKLKSALKKSPVTSSAVKRGRSSSDEDEESHKKTKMEETESRSKRSSSRLKKTEEVAVEKKRSLKIILSRTKDTNMYQTKKENCIAANRDGRQESKNSSSSDEDERSSNETKKTTERSRDDKKDKGSRKKRILPTRKSKEEITLKDLHSSSSDEEPTLSSHAKENDAKATSTDPHSSSASDDDLAMLTQASKKVKDKDEESLHLHLSSSDESVSSTPRKTMHKSKQTKTASKDDEKFRREVFIRLPRIECSKLKKAYMKKQEEKKFKRLTSLKDLLRPFSPRLSKSKKSSKMKKKKQTSKKDESKAAETDASSEDESNKESKSCSPAMEELPDHHVMAAKILMDDIQEDDQQVEEADKDKLPEPDSAGEEPANTTEDTPKDASTELSGSDESPKKADDVSEKEKSPKGTSSEMDEASKEAVEEVSEKEQSSEEANETTSDEEKSSKVANKKSEGEHSQRRKESNEPESDEDQTTKESAKAVEEKKDQTIEEPVEMEQGKEDQMTEKPTEVERENEAADDDSTDIDEALLEEGNPDDIEERMRLLTESPSFLYRNQGKRGDDVQSQTTSGKESNNVVKEPQKLPEDKEMNGDDHEKEVTEQTGEETAAEKNDGEDVGRVAKKNMKENNHESGSKDDEKEKESSDGDSVVAIEDSEDDADKESDSQTEKAPTKTKVKTDSDSGDQEDSNSDKKKAWRKDKLLTEKIDTSDSEDDFTTRNKKNVNQTKSKKPKSKRKRKVLSDSDESFKAKSGSDSDDEKDDSADSSDSGSKKKTKPRKRIKHAKNSSNSSSEEGEVSTRKHIRKVLDKNSLSESTLKAESEEKQRKARIAEKQKKYNNVFEEKIDVKIDKLVLEFSEDKKKELLAVDPRLAKKLKPHQANGIQFMWDACFESLDRAKNSKGSGCILAHCMGLGKTLQVIALTHTLITNCRKTNVERVLVVCPVNTVLNWKAEFKMWLPKDTPFEVYELVSCKLVCERQYRINEWLTDGGVLIIGYSMFRSYSSPDNKSLTKKMRETILKGLIDPGADLVICDEGHLLKNEKTSISIAMNRIKTARRIVLTGTPLQNNLKEYWCMVQFIKPNLLGTYREYMNRFVNPITNGQYTDSTHQDIVLMRKRSHVLHKLLDGVVQRRDYSVLEPYLPPKYEYVVFVKLSEVQVKLYKHYMEKYARENNSGTTKSAFLFKDFQELQRICTHPRVLLDKRRERREKEDDEEDSEGSLRDFIDDGSASGTSPSDSDSASGSDATKGSDNDNDNKPKKRQTRRQRVTRAQAAQKAENGEESDPETPVEEAKQWWQEYCDGEELDNINLSGKLNILFHILKECEEIGDKVLIFSQSLFTLDCIEYFLERIDTATRNDEADKIGGFKGHWTLGLDYFRLDGSSSCDNRAIRCNAFNNPDNIRARLFLISTKAGGLGINLVAANRVIIFDVSWNPSHDIQSIYRVYRFGQKKPCYIYRFVTYGAMEMKIYERQVTKQAISKRVIDEQQIDRHYNQNDLMELYRCDLEPEERPTPLVPKDVLLGEMLQIHDKVIYKYHIHQSLLENKEAECLNEDERKAAWEEFENEKVLRKNTTYATNMYYGNPQLIHTALMNLVRHDNPQWTVEQVRSTIPALVQQLQVQLNENNRALFTRIQQEMYRMQMEKMQNKYKAQQNMIAQQMKQNNALGNMYVNPNQFGALYGMPQAGPSAAANLAGPSAQNFMGLAANDVIELND